METNPAHDRIWNDDASGITVEKADPIAHAPEMLAVLREQGVEAYQQRVAVVRQVFEADGEVPWSPRALIKWRHAPPP